MPKYVIEEGGEKFEIEAPDGMTEDEIVDYYFTEKPKAPEREKTPAWKSGVLGLTQGVPYNDEMAAGLGAIYDYATTDKGIVDAYNERYNRMQKMLSESRQDNPVAHFGGEMAGGMAAGGGAAKAMAMGPGAIGAVGRGLQNYVASAPTTASAAARGAKVGAASGALYGHSQGTGDNRNLSMAYGAGLGAALGGATPYAAEGARKTISGISDMLSRSKGETARLATKGIASSAVKDYGDDALNTLQSRAQNIDDDVRAAVADIGGDRTRSQTVRAMKGATQRTREATAEQLASRRIEQEAKLVRMIDETVGDTDNYEAGRQAVIARRRANSEPLFRQFDNTPLNLETPEFEAIFQRPSVRRAAAQVLEDLQDESVTVAAGVPREGQISTSTFAHRVKEQIDLALSAGERQRIAGTLSAGEARNLNAMRTAKNALTEAIDNNMPPALPQNMPSGGNAQPVRGNVYRQALNAYAGEAALETAQNAGEEAFRRKLRPDEITNTLRDLRSQSEREHFRRGWARMLADKLQGGPVTTDRTGRFNHGIRKQLEAVFPNQANRDRFLQKFGQIADMSDTNREMIVGMQSTAPRAQDLDHMQGAVISKEPFAVAGNLATRAMKSRMAPDVAADTLGQALSPIESGMIDPRLAEELRRRAASDTTTRGLGDALIPGLTNMYSGRYE